MPTAQQNTNIFTINAGKAYFVNVSNNKNYSHHTTIVEDAIDEDETDNINSVLVPFFNIFILSSISCSICSSLMSAFVEPVKS